MTITPLITKAKPKSRGKFERQFIAPFPMEICKSRLEGRTQKPTLWAWRGETRLQVETWRVEDGTVGFQVYKAGKSMWTPNWGRPQTRARGALFEQADGSTQVLVYAGTTQFGYFLYWGVMAALWVVITMYLSMIDVWYLPILSPFILLGMIMYAQYYYNGQHEKLLLIVQETLDKRLV